jgi:GDP-D-mannose dehydratase
VLAGKTTTVRDFCQMAFTRAGMPLRWEGEGVSEVRHTTLWLFAWCCLSPIHIHTGCLISSQHMETAGDLVWM